MLERTEHQVRKETLSVDVTLWTALAALANPVRLRIVLLLREREQCVCHLTDALGLSQGTVSYHMGLLKQAGLVEDRHDLSDARWVYYRLNQAGIAALQTALAGLLDTTVSDRTLADCCSRDSQGESKRREG